MLATALALASCTGCASASRDTDVPECTRIDVRSTRGLRGHAAAVAAVPEGIWVLRVAQPRSARLTLFDRDGDPSVELDADAIFARPGSAALAGRVRIASDGRVLGVLREFGDGTSVLATVEASGAHSVSETIDIPGELTSADRGRFVVYDDWSVRIVEDGRVVAAHDEPVPEPYEYTTRVLAATAVGFVEAVAAERRDGASRITVRGLDAQGRPRDAGVLLDATEQAIIRRVHIATVGDGVVVVYRGEEGNSLARFDDEGRPARAAIPLEQPIVVDALAADDAALWIAGTVSSRWAGSSHDDRHIERLRVMRLDHEGRVTASGRLRTATGSAFLPSVARAGAGRLLGIHLREVVGRLDGRRERIRSRWLRAQCR